VFETLVKNADNTFTLTQHNQVKVNYAALSGATAGKFTSMVDSNGNTVTPTYNAGGELIEVKEASGRKLTLGNTAGRITQITDPLNRNFTLAYDATTNDLITVTFPDTKTIQLAYDASHRITTLTNRALSPWDYTYLADRLKAHYPGTMSGAVKEFVYGNPLTVIDQSGRKVEYHRNANGELWKSIADPGAGKLNLTTTRTFDAQHNVLTLTNPRGKVTTMTWDSNGNMLTATDPMNRVITMTYDARNNRLTLRDNANHLTQWQHSLQNNLLKTIDALVRSTTYAHNDFGQMTLATYPDASTVAMEYDDEGNRTRVTDALQALAFDYNARNLPTIGEYDPATPPASNVENSYDAASDLTSRKDQSTDTTSFEYDAAARMFKATRGPDVVTYTLDANGNITRQDNPNGTYVETTFNDADQPTAIVHRKSDGTIFARFDILYNSDGLISQSDELDGSRTTFGYDALHRVTSDVRTGTNPYNIAYTYDPAGNRLTRVKDGVTTNYAYDAADRMLTAGSDTYNWNANGALTSKVSGGVTTTFDWDFDDYLTKITQGATIVEFKYDGLKRRAQRIAGGVTRDFKYANDQIMVEKEGATIVAEYMLARSMIFREASGAQATYHFDWIGSARALTDTAQAVLATYNYEAFGSIVGSTGSSANAYKYDGAWRYRDDGDFGLLHVGARYYEPGTGRWVSEDTLGGSAFGPQTLNRFGYVMNQPCTSADPTGHEKLKLPCFNLGNAITIGGGIPGAINAIRAECNYISGPNPPGATTTDIFGGIGGGIGLVTSGIGLGIAGSAAVGIGVGAPLAIAAGAVALSIAPVAIGVGIIAIGYGIYNALT